MAERLVPLVVGFLLTTVLGGLLGLLFQRRTWTHQHHVERLERERQEATKVFEELSTLLDRRLYRMRRLWWAAKDRANGNETAALDKARDDYTDVLFVWNDNLNRLGALVEAHFGGATRQQMEQEVYEEFTAIGRALEHFVRGLPGGPAGRMPPLGRRLDALSHRAYKFNLRLLGQLRTGQLAEAAPHVSDKSAGPRALQLGHQGSDVARLQEALRRAGSAGLHVDGLFGAATEDALRDFQRAGGLDADGVAGPRTRAALLTERP